MKLREKYSALKNPSFVKKMMIDSAYGTMQLEKQAVSRAKIERMYDNIQQEKHTSLPEGQ